jgi:hypothetical protein
VRDRVGVRAASLQSRRLRLQGAAEAPLDGVALELEPGLEGRLPARAVAGEQRPGEASDGGGPVLAGERGVEVREVGLGAPAHAVGGDLEAGRPGEPLRPM